MLDYAANGSMFLSSDQLREWFPLSQLTPGRLERLLAVVDRWIDDVSAYSGS
jgi:hypothetical protein